MCWIELFGFERVASLWYMRVLRNKQGRSGIALLWVLGLGGCSGLPYWLGFEQSGFTLQGKYLPYSVELDYSCDQLLTHIRAEEERIVGADIRAAGEVLQPSQKLSTFFSRNVSGSIEGLGAVQDFRRGMARIEALEGVAEKRACPVYERSGALKNTVIGLAKLAAQHQ